jgi:GNAT superfamily N-acetyltransferase
VAEAPVSLQFREAVTETEIRACHPVMAQLRPHLDESAFLQQVQRQRMQGYRLVAGLDAAEQVIVVAGYVLCEKLAWGRHLYVDDLVTAADRRSSGAGAAMLDWLRARALEAGCAALHLDSGVQRIDAHRFYDRVGFERSALHFSLDLPANPAPDPAAEPVPERIGGIRRQDHLQQVLERRLPGAVSGDEGEGEGEGEEDDDDFLDPSHEGGLDTDFDP